MGNTIDSDVHGNEDQDVIIGYVASGATIALAYREVWKFTHPCPRRDDEAKAEIYLWSSSRKASLFAGLWVDVEPRQVFDDPNARQIIIERMVPRLLKLGYILSSHESPEDVADEDWVHLPPNVSWRDYALDRVRADGSRTPRR